jgi:hypothetical protein
MTPCSINPCLAKLVLDAPRLWPVALIGALLAILLVWRLYLPQVRLLHQPWRVLLPALRYAALLALVTSILKPVAVRPATAPEAGAVLVLVDRSRSMSVRDMAYLSQHAQADRGPSTQPALPAGNGIVSPFQRNSQIFQQAQLVANADGLGLLRAGARNVMLTSLHDEVARFRVLMDELSRTRSELNFARLSDQGLTISRQRFNTSASQFRAAGTKLLNESNSLPQPGQINNPFPALAKVLRASDDHLLDDAPNTILALSRWADEAQNNADSQLYQSDPDVRAACDRLAGMSRFARAETALTQSEHGLLSKIPADVPLFGYSIGDDIEALPLRGEGRNVRRLLTEPTAAHSDLLGGVRAALNRMSGQPLQAVILISDGRQTGPAAFPDYAALVAQLGAGSIPLFFVYCAPDNLRLRDVAVGGLVAPESCFVGENLTARVQLSTADVNFGLTTVALSVDGGPPATRPANLAQAAQIFPQSYNSPQGASFAPARQTIEFPLQFEKPGVHHLVASIPSIPDAPTDDNKSLERWIKVLDDKVNVGVYAGQAGWDYQYVLSALGRTPWANLNRGIISADQKLNLTPDQILEQSVLILFDVPVAALSDVQWTAVYKLVADRAGSVILVPGEEHLPQEYGQNTAAADLLPFQTAGGQIPFWRRWPGKEAGFHLSLARSAADVDAFRLDPLRIGDQTPADAFAQLPPFFRFFSLPELKPAARTLLEERDSAAPLLVENRVGLGRTFFMGMNETWRWRMKVGERDQDRFWLQLIRYASDEPYAAHAPGVWLDASLVSAEPGQPIHLRARVEDAQHNPARRLTQILQVTRNDAVVKQVTLARVGSIAGGGGSGRYQGILSGLPAGDYQLRLASPVGEREARLDLHIAPSFEEEMSNLTGVPLPLRRLAETTGGSYLTLGQIGTLANLINRTQIAQNRMVQRPIWDSAYLYAFVVACFAAEWAIRKRVGLV